MQGEFAPGEPVAAVFAWVADCLSDPLHTYELVLPSRQPLEPRAQSGGLWVMQRHGLLQPSCVHRDRLVPHSMRPSWLSSCSLCSWPRSAPSLTMQVGRPPLPQCARRTSCHQ